MSVSRQSGFTLIEVLAAVAVFAVISAISVGLLASALRSQEQIKVAMAGLSATQRLKALLREDVGQIVLRPVRTTQNGTDPHLFMVNGRQNTDFSSSGDVFMVLTRRGWANPGGVQPRSSLQRVRWLYDGETIWREADPYPDVAAGAVAARQKVATGVRELSVEVLSGMRWSDRVDLRTFAKTPQTPPRALRIQYVHDQLGPMEHVLLGPGGEAGP